MIKKSVVDLTTIIAVESLFRSGRRDPWAAQLAGNLADFFIYSDAGRYILPYAAEPDSTSVPDLLSALLSRDGDSLRPIPLEVSGLRQLNPGLLEEAFASFTTWAFLNRGRMEAWTTLQFQDWVLEGHFARIRPRHIFDVRALRESAAFNKTVTALMLPPDRVLHSFDVVLRYPLYGELAGKEAYFLAHPIRALQTLPAMTREKRTAPDVPLSFKDAIAAVAPRLTLDEYAVLLHEARGMVRDLRLLDMPPGSVGIEGVREIASRLRLPPRLRHSEASLVVAGAGTSLLAVFPPMAVPAVLAGVALTIAGVFWKGGLPRGMASASWLAWAIEWDLEKQSTA